MKKSPAEKFLYITVAVVVIVYVFVMIVGLSSCRTVSLQKTKTDTDSSAASKSTYDSTSSKVWDWLYQFGKMTEKTYQPGRDTTIVLQNGEVKVIQLPGQIIKEKTFETRTESASGKEETTLSKSDSLIIELIKSQSNTNKETSSIPVWGWITFGLLAYFLLKDLLSPHKRILP